jgi:predicted permease
MMRFLDAIRFRLRALVRRDAIEHEIDREMELHVEMETARLVRDGVAPGEAQRRARVAFGGRQRFREETRDQVHSRGLDEIGQDIRYAVRTFRKTPSFTLTVILTMALGIGATTVIFSITDHVVLRALPYADADRLMSVQTLSDRLKNVTPTWAPNAAHYVAWQNECTLCAGVAAVRPMSMTLTGTGDPEVIAAQRVSDNLFSILGARAEVGRLFATGDDRPGNSHLIVISDALWRRQFGARSDIVGRTLTFGETPWTVVGVVSPDFQMLGGRLGNFLRLPDHTDAYIPLALTPREQTTAGEHDYGVIARLKPGVPPSALRPHLDAISAAHAAALHDDTPSRSVVVPLRAEVVGAAGRPLILLLAAVAAVLLMMCVNLATLFLARAVSRRRESGVRVALGAGRGRLVRQALVETVLLSCIGGAVGMLLSRWGVQALVAFAPSDLPRLNEVQIDARVLGVAVLASVVAGLAFGLVPALRIGATSPGDVLKESSRAASDGRLATRARAWLIASQVGLSAMLLVAAGLFLHSFVRVMQADRGFTADRVLALNVTLPGKRYRTADMSNAFYAEAMRRVSALPGVTMAGVTNGLPLEGESWIESIWKPGDDGVQGKDFDTNFRFVSPNYFALLGVPIVAGRGFSEADRGASRVVLSANAARALWPNENATGKLLRLGGTDAVHEVIGIAPNVRTTGIEHEGSLTVYIPYWERGYAPTILVRTSVDPTTLVSSVRTVIREIDPTVPISRVRSISQILSSVVAQRRFELVLIGLFALTALLTANIGIYGIIAHTLGRRANEISIRIALGAVPRHVHALVLREVLRPVAAGLLGGIVASVLIGRAAASLLFEVRPVDAATLASVVVVLLVGAALASWIPARRATRLDPVEALRTG